jgi:hypothetical protein
MPDQEVIDRAVAGLVSDGLLIGGLEIVDVQHLAGPRRPFAKRARSAFSSPPSFSRAGDRRSAWA